MSETASGALTTKRIGETFVAEVSGVDIAREQESAWDAIHTAYLEHKILTFRGQKLTKAVP